MGMYEELDYSTISSEELLGRILNDIEAKYAPKSLDVKGPLKIPLPCPRVSIIGTRKPSSDGLEAAERITRALVGNNVVIVSGLAEGIDTRAHQTAIKFGGKTIAVIGTPLNKVYPQKNSQLQQEIMKNHLVISQYPIGYPITRKNFVLRNRTMALISDATIIVEAGDTSGSLHQGWEALRLGRPLFIWTSVVKNEKLTWTKDMLKYGAIELFDPIETLEVLPTQLKMPNLFQ